MKQLQLAKEYFEQYGRPLIENEFPQLLSSYAAGLAGEGSGCFGFDDEISQDHDFAPGFCIWLSDEDYERFGPALRAAYDELPGEFMGSSRANVIDRSRLGPMKISRFYQTFTGCAEGPATNMDWFLISESALAAAENGEVFVDNGGRFSAIRRKLLAFYPDDVLYKKLAARAAVMAQAGQYNLPRCLRRGEQVAANLAAARFIEAAVSAACLINRRPALFYKWAYRGLAELARGDADLSEITRLIGLLSSKPACQESCNLAEEICVRLLDAMAAKGLIQRTASDFTQDYISQLMEKIADPQIRRMHPMADCPL